MLINLEKESSIIKHGFFCKLDENINNIVITNAYQSNYSKGWIDYAPFESEDGKNGQELNQEVIMAKSLALMYVKIHNIFHGFLLII